MRNTVVRFVFHLKLSNHVCPFKKNCKRAPHGHGESMEDLACSTRLFIKEPNYLCERLSYRRDGSNNMKWL